MRGVSEGAQRVKTILHHAVCYARDLSSLILRGEDHSSKSLLIVN